ncbi:rubredoxin [Segetibacter sp. 3557_3]|uniref:rubredoxin n=1 Tax=Segetibacter sp. 3557_3 TaxID=2547429 RepID=UPI0010590CB3|nr:rubredoxin [Segetibacter sp. 3557_3]TDH27324.1 rubredoxin [Segetibacter sp. 3557_3]
MVQSQTVYINFRGGIVSPGNLENILKIAKNYKIAHVRFGLRQQLVVDVPVKYFDAFVGRCLDQDVSCSDKKQALPNLVSSYPAAGIFSGETWLREGVYKDVFDLFDYEPRLKVNVCDSTQNLVPLYTGHINWVSSPAVHFWQLHLRIPRTLSVHRFPGLVYTNDIARISKSIEQLILENPATQTASAIFDLLAASNINNKPEVENVPQPAFSLPYYEGFNRYDNNFWLGIYRRDELFSVPFLLDVCAICLQTKIGQLYTTPWKSLVIKGIETMDRSIWEHVLGRYRINVRHAANELNWQVEENSEEGLQIKRHIVRYFDKEDVRTFGLCFAVQAKPYSRMFGSVLIRKEAIKNPGRLKSLERFEILHTKDFNPNSEGFISYRKNVEKDYLGTYLVSLCKAFYDQQQAMFSNPVPITPTLGTAAKQVTNSVHQCTDCLTVYDPVVGEPELEIAAGTAFNELNPGFCCPLCGSPKSSFKEVDQSTLQLQTA